MSAAGKDTSACRSVQRATRPGERGFTLLEMMVAVAILALITGLAWPAIERLIDRNTMVAARGTVALAVARARSTAITRETPVSVTLDANASGQLAFSSGLLPMPLPPGVTVEWPEGGIVIYGDGSAPAATGVIHAGAAASRFTVDQATARVSFVP